MKFLVAIFSIMLFTSCSDEAQQSNIFIGDSHVAGWDLHRNFPGRGTSNFGIGGQQIVEIHQRLAAISGDNCFIIAGTNDFIANVGKPPDGIIAEIIVDYRNLLGTAGRNFTKTYVISVFPVGENFSCTSCIVHRDEISVINDSLKNLVERDFRNVVFLEVTGILAGANTFLKSQYTDDGLHLNERGYEILSEKVRPYVK